MRTLGLRTKESIGKLAIEDITQIQQIGAAECQVCDNRIQNGEAAQAYVFRPAGAREYQVGHIQCTGRHDVQPPWTLGVEEHVLEGRIQRGPTLTNLSVRATSPPAGTEGRR